MTKTKKLYQKVDVKPKRFGNNNTNAINIIIRPEEKEKNEEEERAEKTTRPSSTQILNTLSQQPSAMDDGMKHQVLGRVSRLDGQSLSKEDLEQQFQQQQQQQLDMIQRMNDSDARQQMSGEANEELIQHIEELRNHVDLRGQMEEEANDAYKMMISQGVKTSLLEMEDRLRQEFEEQHRFNTPPMTPPQSEIDELEDAIAEKGGGDYSPPMTDTSKTLQDLESFYNTLPEYVELHKNGEIGDEELLALRKEVKRTEDNARSIMNSSTVAGVRQAYTMIQQDNQSAKFFKRYANEVHNRN